MVTLSLAGTSFRGSAFGIGLWNMEEAVAMSEWSLAQTKALKDKFCEEHPACENEETLALLRDVQKEIMRISVKEELYG